MAILQVSPTRMNLLGLAKKIKTAKKGHKLLKDKRDGLMKEFMKLIKEARATRHEVEDKMSEVSLLILKASRSTNPKVIETVLYNPDVSIELEVKEKNIMSVKIPEFSHAVTGEALGFNTTGISPFLPLSIQTLQDALPLLLKLSGMEKAVEALAKEIEVTRRRVNSLEYIMIPNLEDTVKYIKLQLDEANRDAVVSVMRVKAMIDKKEREEKMLQERV
ncbi:TPA: V-type ATP synthase subunit D [Candidatus Gracilibacteria bacterium]|nr:V-type ATP synthase subunit D [Candidatus Gracilibacteria bacterium]